MHECQKLRLNKLEVVYLFLKTILYNVKNYLA